MSTGKKLSRTEVETQLQQVLKDSPRDADLLATAINSIRRKKNGRIVDSALTLSEAEDIVEVALDRDTISNKEKQALEIVVRYDRIRNEAREFLQEFLTNRKGTRRNKKRLRGDALNAVLQTLRSPTNLKFIHFTSPGTKLSYGTRDYHEVAQDIRDDLVRVHEFDYANDGETEAKPYYRGQAVYQSREGTDHLALLRGLSGVSRDALVIHEATHRIQDVHDVNSKVKFIEADAYLAQALVYASREIERFCDLALGKVKQTALWHRATPVAQDVVSGKEVNKYRYAELVQAVAAHRLYKHKAEDIRYPAGS